MTSRSERAEATEANTKPQHIDHRVENVGTNKAHKWRQVGVEMVCDGNKDHFRHGFHVPPELVFVEETVNGLKFRNVKTNKEVEIRCP